MNTEKIITLVLKSRDEISGKLQTTKKVLEGVDAKGRQFRKTMERVGTSLRVTSKVLTSFDSKGRRIISTYGLVNNKLKLVEKRIQNVGKATKQSSIPFAGYALSLMFFGMAIQRVFNTIWTQATKTFQDVQHSVEGTVTPLDILNAQFEMLRYEAGSALMNALEPLLPKILEIIDSVSQWISENPKLFASLVLIAGILGTLLTVGGMLKLSFDGFRGAILAISPAVSKMVASIGGVGGVATGGIIALLGLAAYEADLGDLKDLVKKTFTSLFGEGGFLPDIWDKLKKTVGAVWDFLKALFGDDEKELDNALNKLGGALLGAFIDMWALMTWTSENGMRFLIKSLIDLLTGALGRKFMDAAFEFLNPWLHVLDALAWAGVDWAEGLQEKVKSSMDGLKDLVSKTGKDITDSKFFEFNTYQDVKDRDMFKTLSETADNIYNMGVEPEQMVSPQTQGVSTMYYNYNNYYNATSDEIQSSPNPWALQLNSSL